jgi:hypothetical protein
MQMYCEVTGSGDPLVVLHGAYMNIPAMGEIIPMLAETHTVYALELQGHGRTTDIDRPIFEEAVNADCYLLTFIGAHHNACAPMPAPREAWEPAEGLDFVPAEHYTDAVWDNVRMNNIAQHFTTAYFGKMLKGDAGMERYLALVEMANNGVADRDGAGKPTAANAYWAGFPLRSAIGLRLEHRLAP